MNACPASIPANPQCAEACIIKIHYYRQFQRLASSKQWRSRFGAYQYWWPQKENRYLVDNRAHIWLSDYLLENFCSINFYCTYCLRIFTHHRQSYFLREIKIRVCFCGGCDLMGRPNLSFKTQKSINLSLSLSLSIYIYIYIYMCVCVCVCVDKDTRVFLQGLWPYGPSQFIF